MRAQKETDSQLEEKTRLYVKKSDSLNKFFVTNYKKGADMQIAL